MQRQPMVLESSPRTDRNLLGVFLVSLFVLSVSAAGCIHISPGDFVDLREPSSKAGENYPLSLGVRPVTIKGGDVRPFIREKHYHPMAPKVTESFLMNLRNAGLFKEVGPYEGGMPADAILDVEVVINELPMRGDGSDAITIISGYLLGFGTFTLLPGFWGTTMVADVSVSVSSPLLPERKTYKASGREKSFWWGWLFHFGYTTNPIRLLSSAMSQAFTDVHHQIATDTSLFAGITQKKQENGVNTPVP